MFTAREHPLSPDEPKPEKSGMAKIFDELKNMPPRMKQHAFMPFFTWLGLFRM